MPDFNTVFHWHCETAENWSKDVAGSKPGVTYKVTWDRNSHKNRQVQFDWSCSCPGYQKRGGVYCKHIILVRNTSHENGGRCGWQQFIEGGEPKNGKCPRCGGEIHPQGYAV